MDTNTLRECMLKNFLQTTQVTSTPFPSSRNPALQSNQVGQEWFTDTKSHAAFSNSFTFFLLQPLTTAIKCLVARDILYESQFQLSFVIPYITLLALAKSLNSSCKTFPCFYTLYHIFSAPKLVHDFSVHPNQILGTLRCFLGAGTDCPYA